MPFAVRRLKEERRRKLPILYTFLLIIRPVLRRILSQKQQHEERTRNVRCAAIAIAAVCAALLIVIAWNLLQSLRTLSVSTLLSASSATIAEDAYGHTNILLLGQGDSTHDGTDLIDSITVASLDRAAGTIALLSLPRDLYFLRTEDMGTGRLNSLYRDKKYALQRKGHDEREASLLAVRALATEIAQALSLEVHHAIKVDFTGFIAAVDAIGGIPIDIPESLTDPAFPGPNYTTETFSIQKGRQTLDGLTALKYARSRSTTSDFDRSARQHLLLEALGQRVREMGLLTKPKKLLELLDIISNHVETTLSLRELLAIAKIGRNISSPHIVSLHLSDRNGLYGEILEPGGFLYAPPRDQFEGASVLLPISIPAFPVTWKQLQALVDIFLHRRMVYDIHAPISILNAGAPVGSARLLANELLRYGFPIGNVENAPFAKQEQSFVLSGNNPEGEAALRTLLRLPDQPPSLSPAPPAQEGLTIMLGKNYRFVHLQNLLQPPPS